MEIQRIPSHRNRGRGWKTIVKPDAVGTFTINEDRNVQIAFRSQQEPYSTAEYDYRIILTSADINNIVAELFKQVQATKK